MPQSSTRNIVLLLVIEKGVKTALKLIMQIKLNALVVRQGPGRIRNIWVEVVIYTLSFKKIRTFCVLQDKYKVELK